MWIKWRRRWWIFLGDAGGAFERGDVNAAMNSVEFRVSLFWGGCVDCGFWAYPCVVG